MAWLKEDVRKPWRGPTEVGAPACAGLLSPQANALTPRGLDLFPVLGPGIHHHGLLRIQRPRPREVALTSLAARPKGSPEPLGLCPRLGDCS